jgi:hypothetical protein
MSPWKACVLRRTRPDLAAHQSSMRFANPAMQRRASALRGAESVPAYEDRWAGARSGSWTIYRRWGRKIDRLLAHRQRAAEGDGACAGGSRRGA